MGKYKFEDMDYVNRMIEKWKDKSYEKQRELIKKLNKKINELFVKAHDKPSEEKMKYYNKRNELVRIKWGLNKNLPFLFTPGQKVIVNWKKRPIQAIVIALGKPEYREVTVKPVDNVYKEPFIISEDLLVEAEEQPIKDEQLTLSLF